MTVAVVATVNWGEVALVLGGIAAIIASLGGILAAYWSRSSAKSVGKKNGDGSIQEQLATVSANMGRLWSVVASGEESRLAGQQRSVDTVKKLTNIEERLSCLAKWAEEHNTADTAEFAAIRDEINLCVGQLHSEVESVHKLIGPIGDGDVNLPLNAYAHKSIHDLRNQIFELGLRVDILLRAAGIDIREERKRNGDEEDGWDGRERRNRGESAGVQGVRPTPRVADD